MGAIAVHHTATVDTPWDKSTMKAEGETALRYCHAWVDSSADPDLVGSYKFPHATGEGAPANLAACRNGLARLDSADIPDSDRAGVKAHLQAHLDDGQKSSSEDAVRTPITNLAALGQMSDEQRVHAQLPRVRRYSNLAAGFRITDYTDGTPARLDLYDEIGWSFWGDGVTASTFNAELQAIQAPSIELHINCPGGDVFDALAILNLLRAQPRPVDVVVDGMAASAASFIAMAGDTVTMMPNSTMMIHDASGVCMGNHADMTAMADLLDKMSANIADVYATKTGKPVDEWRTAMRAETWYTADEAVAAGLADRVGELARGQHPATANKAWNLNFYAYSGRDAAPTPTPVSPVADNPPAAPATPDPIVATVPTPAAPQIDLPSVQAALRGMFSTKEARS